MGTRCIIWRRFDAKEDSYFYRLVRLCGGSGYYLIEVKDGVEVITVEAIHLENKEFFAIQADYFENEGLAEKEGFYWEDQINKWTKEILDNTTTIF